MRLAASFPARLIALPLIAALAGCAGFGRGSAEPIPVKVLAINDFHGHLKPPTGGARVRDPQDPARHIDIAAGGAEHLATAVREARRKNPNHVFVAAGDLVGASPLLSALFHDEPAIEALDLMGLEASAVGNHEFDHGAAELLRKQHGGCHPRDGCRGPQAFQGARFSYLAASTIDSRTGQTLLPAYHVKRFQGVPVAFIGLTLAATPTIVLPSGVAGLEFRDEAQTVNALVPQLRAQGIEAIVVLIHEGGFPAGGHDGCEGISGPIVDIVGKLDPAVDLVVSGHTHRAYTCRIDGRLVTSADKHGTLLTEIDLTLDPRSGDVIEARAANLVVRHDRYAADPAQTRLIAGYEALAAPLARRQVGRLGGPLSREESPAGETAIGRMVADAQLMAAGHLAAGGARIALTNPGGLRSDLVGGPEGTVRYEDIFAVQPFGNHLVTLTLTGEQLRQLLEQQWQDPHRPRILQVSRGFGYTWDAGRPAGQRVLPGSLRLDGEPIEPGRDYRVVVNNYLAAGGDGFTVLRQGRDVQTGPMDIDAFEAWFRSHEVVRPDPAPRIRRQP